MLSHLQFEVLLEAVACPPFQLKQAQQGKKPGYYVCIHVADKGITPPRWHSISEIDLHFICQP